MILMAWRISRMDETRLSVTLVALPRSLAICLPVKAKAKNVHKNTPKPTKPGAPIFMRTKAIEIPTDTGKVHEKWNQLHAKSILWVSVDIIFVILPFEKIKRAFGASFRFFL